MFQRLDDLDIRRVIKCQEEDFNVMAIIKSESISYWLCRSLKKEFSYKASIDPLQHLYTVYEKMIFFFFWFTNTSAIFQDFISFDKTFYWL